MSLASIRIARRFQKSIRIDTDFGDPRALEGFVCPRSSADVLLTMSRHISEAGHCAFTWTGPYGTGKSSLAIAFGALLNGNNDLRSKAAKLVGREFATSLWKRLPLGTKGWRFLPVVGRRDDPIKVIGEAFEASGLAKEKPRGGWNEKRLLQALVETAERSPNNYGGFILFVDEMGKFLEHAAQDGTDIYFFQQLAELASRSKGRLIVIGVLHQAFEEYAHRLSHQTRDEWAKIQGRFIDLAINTAGEEQIDLLSRAIESDHPKRPRPLAQTVARIARPERRVDSDRLSEMLEACWPLHPVVACLLGPISRRRFGQNQRSLFGFLNSSEPQGFKDFLKHARAGSLYGTDLLWDYLRANLEPSILASPDGHRWALASEALERCEALGGDALHISLLKTIALVDMFKERSGLVASAALLRACGPASTDATFKKALAQLASWSLVIFKKFLDSYAVYAGSDFDIDQALREAAEDIGEIDFESLKSLAGLQPILAKRHYHTTGALRWFDVNLAPLADLMDMAADSQPKDGTIGQFLLAIPTEGETHEHAAEMCREIARQSTSWDIVVGLSKRSWAILASARELLALESVRLDRPELAGDAVARREVTARLTVLQAQLETELRRAFDSATWYRKHHQPKSCRQAELNSLASDLADRRYGQSPRLHNELLNRYRPSSNAIAAQNILLRRMVLNEGEPRLGITDFPAEGGLLISLLEGPGLYSKGCDGWRFRSPPESDEESYCLSPIWSATADFVRKHANRAVSVSELYDLWRAQPFGLKDGLMPLFAVAFILSQRDGIALYREGIFRARFDDVDVEYLAKDPSMIQMRWMNLSDVARRLLSAMAEVVRQLDARNSLVHLEPIDVARGLVSIYENLPPWTKRTARLSANAVRIRELFKRARDPNKFLFDDIPLTLAHSVDLASDAGLRQVVQAVRQGLEELIGTYPSALQRMRDLMLSELQVPNIAPHSLAELRDRALNIKDLAGDFRLEAFVGRLALIEGNDIDIAGIAGHAADKPPRDWVDADLDRASIEISDLSQKFLRTETFARVKGRPQKRQAVAVVIGMSGSPIPILEEFAVAEGDREAVNELIARVAAALELSDTTHRSVILAALTEITARYMQPSLQHSEPPKRRTTG
jgi:hypothetical protein